MKLRCSSGSIRLRVLRSDIEALRQSGRVLESIGLPGGGSFGFALQIDNKPAGMSAFWEDRLLTVSLPAKPARDWMDSEQVGMEASLSLPDGAELHLLVEKDFPCQHQETSHPGETFGELVPPES